MWLKSAIKPSKAPFLSRFAEKSTFSMKFQEILGSTQKCVSAQLEFFTTTYRESKSKSIEKKFVSIGQLMAAPDAFRWRILSFARPSVQTEVSLLRPFLCRFEQTCIETEYIFMSWTRILGQFFDISRPCHNKMQFVSKISWKLHILGMNMTISPPNALDQ